MKPGLSCLALLLLGGATTAGETQLIRLPDKPTPNTMALASADLDGDGDLDMVRAIEFGPDDLLLNDGQGRFDARILPGGPGDHEDVALADFDKDGDIDGVSLGEDDQVSLYLDNDGSAHFTEQAGRFPARLTANGVIAADLDGDGDPDLAVAANGQDAVWLNDGTGRFVALADALPTQTHVSQDVAAGDLDGDSDIDLVFGGEDGNRLYLNVGDARFRVAPLPQRSAPEETRDVVLADVDRDGDLDLYFANVSFFVPNALRQDRLLMNNGHAVFSDATADHLPMGRESTTSAVFVDLDGDGAPDLVRAFTNSLEPGEEGPHAEVYRNDGNGRFLAQGVPLPDGVRPQGFDIEPGDYNGDGVTDLAFASRGTDDLLLLSP